MRINKALNLVIPVDMESGEKAYVHSTPVSLEVFEQFFEVIGISFNKCWIQFNRMSSGKHLAYFTLKKTANELGEWESVEKGFINEIVRLSNVAFVGENGWETLPLQTALNHNKIDKESFYEFRGQLVFFTLVSLVHNRNQIQPIMDTVNGLWGSQLESLDFTEFTNSLRTSTTGENTGETETTSLLPA